MSLTTYDANRLALGDRAKAVREWSVTFGLPLRIADTVAGDKPADEASLSIVKSWEAIAPLIKSFRYIVAAPLDGYLIH